MSVTHTEEKLQSINPATGELIKEFDIISDDELERKVQLAENTFHQFRNTSFQERSKWMKKVAELLEKNAEKYGKTLAQEIGKTISQAISEPKKCAKWANYFAENSEEFLADKRVSTESGKKTIICYEPMGVLFQIAPFNFPFLQVLRFVTPAVMAGNCCLIRHSHTATLSALLIEDLFREAGFPEGVLQVLLINKDQANKLIADSRIRGITVTGSVNAGKAIAKEAGRHLKKNVMELGGSDGYIICDDVDMDKVVPECVQGRIVNNGQSCTSAKRFIVVENRYQEFCEKFTKKMKEVKMGDPMKDEMELGPLSRKDLRDQVHEAVEKAVKEGAKLLCGGYIPEGPGFYYPPTVLADVPPNSTAFDEEIFGPVASLMKVKDIPEAIELVNKSHFGLGGGVFTPDENKGEEIGRKLDVGLVAVNRIVTSSPEYPFGGTKDSGYGRESGREGIMEWVRIKSLIVK